MQERQAGRLGGWLHARRRTLTFRTLVMCCCIIGFVLFGLIGLFHLDGDFNFVAAAFIALAGTCNIAALASEPTSSRDAATPRSRGNERPLLRIVAWGLLVPIAAECGMVWFALHHSVDTTVLCTQLAFGLNALGTAGVLTPRLFRSKPTLSDTSPGSTGGS